MIVDITNRLKTRKFAQELAAFPWDDLFAQDDDVSIEAFDHLIGRFQLEIIQFSDGKYAETKADTLKFISKEDRWHAERFFDCMDLERLELLENSDINTGPLSA